MVELSKWFYGESRVVACFLTAEILLAGVELATGAPTIRNAIRWEQIFSGGEVTRDAIADEVRSAEEEQYGVEDK